MYISNGLIVCVCLFYIYVHLIFPFANMCVNGVYFRERMYTRKWIYLTLRLYIECINICLSI